MNNLTMNKQVVSNFLDAIRNLDPKTMRSLMTEDAQWWVSPTTRLSGTYKRDDFLELVPKLFGQVVGKFGLTVADVTAEDDRVSVTAKGDVKMKNGKVYANEYHFLFKLRDGRIVSGKEYSDTAHVNDVLQDL
jgi:ketosteroid isomerase-like protein